MSEYDIIWYLADDPNIAVRIYGRKIDEKYERPYVFVKPMIQTTKGGTGTIYLFDLGGVSRTLTIVGRVLNVYWTNVVTLLKYQNGYKLVRINPTEEYDPNNPPTTPLSDLHATTDTECWCIKSFQIGKADTTVVDETGEEYKEINATFQAYTNKVIG